jgi:hypothetical protein
MNNIVAIRVGYLKQEIIDLLGVKLNPGEIKLLPGGVKHIRKRRKELLNGYMSKIPKIIKEPNYVGTNPKYQNSVEFIKNILVAVRLNDCGNLCVATMFDVTESKVTKMLEYGRIFKIK